MVDVTEQERHVHQRRHLRIGRHVARRHDGVVDRHALRHEVEVVLLEPELGILVEDEADLTVVAFVDQLGEADERLGEGVLVTELRGAVQLDRVLRRRRAGERQRGHDGERSDTLDLHRSLPGWPCLMTRLFRCGDLSP